MSYVVTNPDNNQSPRNSKLDKADKLYNELAARKAVETDIAQIAMIEQAMEKIDETRSKEAISHNISKSNLGSYSVQEPVKAQAIQQVSGVITDNEAKQIEKIKSVQGVALAPGQKFASMSGKEPSNISYMKTNIAGLFDLVDSKETV